VWRCRKCSGLSSCVRNWLDIHHAAFPYTFLTKLNKISYLILIPKRGQIIKLVYLIKREAEFLNLLTNWIFIFWFQTIYWACLHLDYYNLLINLIFFKPVKLKFYSVFRFTVRDLKSQWHYKNLEAILYCFAFNVKKKLILKDALEMSNF